MSIVALVIAFGAWVFTIWFYRRAEKRWASYERDVIPGSPQVTVHDLITRHAPSPWAEPGEPIYFSRLAQTKARQAEYERETAKVRVLRSES